MGNKDVRRNSDGDPNVNEDSDINESLMRTLM